MSALSEGLDSYVALRRRMGFVVRNETYALEGFVRFCDGLGAEIITTDLVMAWVMAPQGVGRSWLAKRFGLARSFAVYLHGFDANHQIPPARMVTDRYRRRNPYLYNDVEIVALMDAASRLRGELRPVTYRTVIGLLAVTGLRISEAINLNDDTVNLDDGHLTIRNTKFNKSRLVPLQSSTVDALHRYLASRSAAFADHAPGTGFFVTDTGRQIHYRQCQATFAQCLELAGMTTEPRRRPTLHDLRHTFAVNTLIDWYRSESVDVAAMMPYLSTYLGHVDPKSTYWYLTASPELAAVVAGRLDNTFEVTP